MFGEKKGSVRILLEIRRLTLEIISSPSRYSVIVVSFKANYKANLISYLGDDIHLHVLSMGHFPNVIRLDLGSPHLFGLSRF